MIYMYSGLGLRGDLVPDICHKRHRGSLGAWHDAGLDAVRVECGIIMNLFRGPFGKHANLQVLKGVARQFYASETANNIVYRSCYELIVRCQCEGKLPHDFGSNDHIEATWRELPHSELFTTSGVMMKFSRWYSFTERARIIRRFVGEMFMILLVLGVMEKFYDHVSEIPFFAHEYKPSFVLTIEDDAIDAEVAPPVGASAAASSSTAPIAVTGAPPPLRDGVAGTKDGTEKFAKTHKRNLQLALRITGRSSTRRLLIAMETTSAPIERQHRLTMSIVKTQMAVREWVVSAAQGDYVSYLSDVMALLTSKSFLEIMEFEIIDLNVYEC
jgi:hypothetical protein